MTCGLWCLLVLPLIGEGATPAGTGFDEAALQRELSQPVLELHRQGPEALRLHVQGLAELDGALETTQGVSPEERRAQGDRILTRQPRRVFSCVPTDQIRPGPTTPKETRYTRRR